MLTTKEPTTMQALNSNGLYCRGLFVVSGPLRGPVALGVFSVYLRVPVTPC